MPTAVLNIHRETVTGSLIYISLLLQQPSEVHMILCLLLCTTDNNEELKVL